MSFRELKKRDDFISLAGLDELPQLEIKMNVQE